MRVRARFRVRREILVKGCGVLYELNSVLKWGGGGGGDLSFWVYSRGEVNQSLEGVNPGICVGDPRICRIFFWVYF